MLPARRDRVSLADPSEAVHGFEELLALRLRFGCIARREGARDAVVHVVIEDLEGEALERRVHGSDLREHVDAIAVVLDHPLDAAHLALDPVEPANQRFLVLGIAVRVLAHAASRTEWKRRSRSELVTTNTLEKAIAAAATIGFRRPAIASGIAATL